MQRARMDMNEDNNMIHLYVQLSDQHPRTLDKLADYSAMTQENTNINTE